MSDRLPNVGIVAVADMVCVRCNRVRDESSRGFLLDACRRIYISRSGLVDG